LLRNTPTYFRSRNERLNQRPPRAFFAVVLYLYRHVTDFAAVPKVKFDHVLLSFGEKGFPQVFWPRGGRFPIGNFAEKKEFKGFV
jgi:hypothetical protein